MTEQEISKRLAGAVAQLRHAYHQLIGPDGAWDREQRMRFADGLIAREIVSIEEVIAALTAHEGQIMAMRRSEPRSREYLDDVALGQHLGWNQAIDAVLATYQARRTATGEK